MPRASKEAEVLWPYLLKKIEKLITGSRTSSGSGSAGTGGAPTPHALSSVHHSGTLDNAQGPQFLLTDGSRDLTGHLAVDSGITIDGVDLSAHVLDPDAHHARATAGNTAISVSGQAVSVALAGASGLDISSGLMIADSVAGSGLAISIAKILSVNVSDGLEIVSDNVAVDLAANSGLLFVSGDLAMGTPTTLAHDTTSSVTTDTHAHAVTASSDVSAGFASLLKSTPAGGLGLASLFTTGAADIGEGFTAGNTGFRVIYHTHDYPHTHVVVNPTGLWNLDEQFGLDVDDNLLVRGWIVGKHAIQVADAKMLVHYDGPAPVETNFKGNATGHMGQAGVLNGGIVYREGKFGKALALGVTKTNLITNPSFETNTTGWAAFGTGASISRSGAAGTTVGSFALWLQLSDAFTGVAYSSVSLLNGVQYTLSFDVKLVGGSSADWQCELNATGGYAIKTFTPTTTWQRVTHTFVSTAAAVHAINFYRTTAGFGWIAIDGVQLEASLGTPYFDGSLDDALVSPTYAATDITWAGTAHGSTSTRNATWVEYSDPTLHDFDSPMTVMAWIKPTAVTGSAYQVIVSKTTVGETDGWELANHSGWLHVVMRNSLAQVGNSVAACLLTQDVWNFVSMTYDGATITLYVNGAFGASVAKSGAVATASPLQVGRRPSGDYFNGLVDELSLIRRVLTEDEIRAIYESNAPVFAETSTWHWRAGRNRIYADAEGLWGYGASGATILGLYAGEDNNPSATKSWGGVYLSEGDLLLGRYGASDGGWMHFDQDLVGGLPAWRFGYADEEVIRLDSGGASLNGVLDIDSSGGIYQGDGVFTSGSEGTGLKIWNDGGIGRIGGFNNDVLQWSAETSGMLVAGSGTVYLNQDGIAIVGDGVVDYTDLNNFLAENALMFRDSSDGSPLGFIGAAGSGGAYAYLSVGALPIDDTDNATLYLFAKPLDLAYGAGTSEPYIQIDGGASVGSKVTINGQDILIGHDTGTASGITLFGTTVVQGTIFWNVGHSAAALGSYAGYIPVTVAGIGVVKMPYYT